MTMPDTPELPPRPEPRIVSYQTDGAMRTTELRTYDGFDMDDYARAAILADRATRLAEAPKGWVLVPVEPTHAMQDAAHKATLERYDFMDPAIPPAVYRAMLDAAPAASSPEAADEPQEPSGA